MGGVYSYFYRTPFPNPVAEYLYTVVAEESKRVYSQSGGNAAVTVNAILSRLQETLSSIPPEQKTLSLDLSGIPLGSYGKAIIWKALEEVGAIGAIFVGGCNLDATGYAGVMEAAHKRKMWGVGVHGGIGFCHDAGDSEEARRAKTELWKLLGAADEVISEHDESKPRTLIRWLGCVGPDATTTGIVQMLSSLHSQSGSGLVVLDLRGIPQSIVPSIHSPVAALLDTRPSIQYVLLRADGHRLNIPLSILHPALLPPTIPDQQAAVPFSRTAEDERIDQSELLSGDWQARLDRNRIVASILWDDIIGQVMKWDTIVAYRLLQIRRSSEPLLPPRKETEAAVPAKLHEWHISVGVAEMQGKRKEMENHVVLTRIPDPANPPIPSLKIRQGTRVESTVLVGVVDGHGGGGACSKIVSMRIGSAIRDAIRFGAEPRRALHDAVDQVDDSMRDARVPGGACAVFAYVQPRPDIHQIAVGAIGDCRAALYVYSPPSGPLLSEPTLALEDSGFVSSPMHGFASDIRLAYETRCVRPSDPAERARVEAGGAFVSGDGRVNGILAVSRAFGNHILRPAVQPRMESDSIRLARAPGSVCVLVLACDGLWDAYEPAHLPSVWPAFHPAPSRKSSRHSSRQTPSSLPQTPDFNPRVLARRFRNAAYANGSTDNISVVVMAFPDRTLESVR